MQAWHRQVSFAPGDDLRGPSGSEGNRVWLASRGGPKDWRDRSVPPTGRLGPAPGLDSGTSCQMRGPFGNGLPVEAAVVAIGAHRAADQMVGDILEVVGKLIVEPVEFRPNDPVESRSWARTIKDVRLCREYRYGLTPCFRQIATKCRTDHMSGNENRISIVGSRLLSERPRRPFSRPIAAAAAVRSPGLDAARNSASTLASFALKSFSLIISSHPVLISTVYSGRFRDLPSVPGLLRSVGYHVPDWTRGDLEAFPDRGIEAEHPGLIAVILTGPPECASSCKSNSQTLVRFRDREVLMAPTGTASGFASRRGPGSTNCTVNGQRTEHDTEGRLPRSCPRQSRCWRLSPVLSPRRRSGHIGLHGGFATV